MFIYEKDYIMRMIYGITQMLAVILFGKKLNSEEVFIALGDEFRGSNDLLLEMVDKGEINAAEDRLFDIIELKDAMSRIGLAVSEYTNI